MHIPDPLSDYEWNSLLNTEAVTFISDISNSLKYNNRFFADERLEKLLYEYSNDQRWSRHSNLELQKGIVLYRGRIYKEDDFADRFNHPENYGSFQGYDEENSFVVKNKSIIEKIEDGRANPSYIPYLYCASDIDTAILEIRSQPGEYVSIAKIETQTTLKIFDLSKNSTSVYDASRPREQWINCFYLKLVSAFQRPYSRTGHYYFTQYVSEFLKNIGFDGIAFRSSVQLASIGDRGINYTVFNHEKCKAVSSSLYHIDEMTVKTRPKIEQQEGNSE